MPDSTDSSGDGLDRLFEQVRNGNEDAARDLYIRLKSCLEAYLRKNRVIGKHLRPDLRTTEVAHDALVRLFDAVDREKFTYRGKRSLLAWLITVMSHSIADSSHVCHPFPLPPGEILEDRHSLEQIAILADILEDTRTIFDELAMEVLQLWLQGYSQREIADHFKHLKCDRRRVRRILEEIALRLTSRVFADDQDGNIA